MTVVLGQLQKENLIKIARRRVVILQLQTLAEAVNEKVPVVGGNEPLGSSQVVPRFSSF